MKKYIIHGKFGDVEHIVDSQQLGKGYAHTLEEYDEDTGELIGTSKNRKGLPYGTGIENDDYFKMALLKSINRVADAIEGLGMALTNSDIDSLLTKEEKQLWLKKLQSSQKSDR